MNYFGIISVNNSLAYFDGEQWHSSDKDLELQLNAEYSLDDYIEKHPNYGYLPDPILTVITWACDELGGKITQNPKIEYQEGIVY